MGRNLSAKAFVIWLLTLPILVRSELVSPNDPFRALALQSLIPPDNPVCCLKPLPSEEPDDNEILLSFEQWKAKQSAVSAANDGEGDLPKRQGSKPAETNDEGIIGATNVSDLTLLTHKNASQTNPHSMLSSDEHLTDYFNEPISPHFRVPLTDRFNYANSDCSARVHLSHRSAKSSSAILSSKRDRYMLSPCNSVNAEQQFVVVELCEDIRIDTVQLANFEFFSGVFKDFTVSVAKTYSVDRDGWTTAGNYRAKNVRGVQSFHLTSLRDFYRYIRIDFHSHYGNEYYCPVSLLRVYGLTHLEQWKWDEAESQAKQVELDKVRLRRPLSHIAHIDLVSENLPSPLFASEPNQSKFSVVQSSSAGIPWTFQSAYDPPSTVMSTTSTEEPPTPSIPQKNPITEPLNSGCQTPSLSIDTLFSSTSIELSVSSLPDLASESPVILVETSFQASPSSGTSSHAESPPSVGNINISSPHASSSVSSPTLSLISTKTSIPASPSILVTVPTSPTISVSTGGESIYKTIMNRLSAIESNHDLYSRYVEQQNRAVRDVIRRLGEDLGRLEGIGRAQESLYKRNVHEWQTQRKQVQIDYNELVAQIEYLSDEIILEKRLGIAQLCLLLAVLVFMGLTRGSRGEAFMEHAPGKLNRSMQEWGKRHFRLGSDWATLLRSRGKRRSTSPGSSARPHTLNRHVIDTRNSPDERVVFPTEITPSPSQPLVPVHLNGNLTSEGGARMRTLSGSRPQTPSQRTRRANVHTPQSQQTRLYHHSPQLLQRSNSQGTAAMHVGSGSIPRSARRWARSAHIHEVRSSVPLGKGRRGGDSANLNLETVRLELGSPDSMARGYESGDVFLSLRSAPLLEEVSARRETGRQWDSLGSQEHSIPVDLLKFKTRDADMDPWVDMDNVEGSDIDLSGTLA